MLSVGSADAVCLQATDFAGPYACPANVSSVSALSIVIGIPNLILVPPENHY